MPNTNIMTTLWKVSGGQLSFTGTCRDAHTRQLVITLTKAAGRVSDNIRVLNVMCRHSYDRRIVYEFCDLFALKYIKTGTDTSRSKHGYRASNLCDCCCEWIRCDDYILTYTRFAITMPRITLWKHSSIRNPLSSILPTDVIINKIYPYLENIHCTPLEKIIN